MSGYKRKLVDYNSDGTEDGPPRKSGISDRYETSGNRVPESRYRQSNDDTELRDEGNRNFDGHGRDRQQGIDRFRGYAGFGREGSQNLREESTHRVNYTRVDGRNREEDSRRLDLQNNEASHEFDGYDRGNPRSGFARMDVEYGRDLARGEGMRKFDGYEADGQATRSSNQQSKKRTEPQRAGGYNHGRENPQSSASTTADTPFPPNSSSASASAVTSTQSTKSRFDVIKSWQIIGSGQAFGTGNMALLPRDVISDRMKFSIHGWKREEGFLIPFFAVVLRHPQVFCLTTGTQRPPELITRFQDVNPALKARFAFTVCRRDSDRKKQASLVFVTITLRKEFYTHVRNPYILADLADIMEFLYEYKQVLVTYGDRDRKPPTINVAFKDYLEKNRELPHPPNYEFPASFYSSGTGNIKVEASVARSSGNISPRNHNSGWMSLNIPYRPQTPSVSSSLGRGPSKETVGHRITQPSVLSALSAPLRRPGYLPLGTEASTVLSRFSVGSSASPQRLLPTPPPPPPPVATPSSTQIPLGDSGSDGNGEISMLSPSMGSLPSLQQTSSGMDGVPDIDMPTHRIISRRHTHLSTRTELGEIIEGDLGIYTTDSLPSAGVSVDRPLQGVSRDVRRVMHQRYSNLSLVDLCQKLEEDFFIFTKD